MNYFFTTLGWATIIALSGGIELSFSQSPLTMSPPVMAQVTSKIYNGPEYNFPIKTQYPNTMQVEGGCGGEGCGFSFTFLPQDNDLDNAEVHIFIPRGTKTAAEQAVFITGANGLIENNGWAIAELGQPPQQLSADWVKQVINFRTEENETGQIILGEVDGQAVQIMVIYPTPMADQFWSGAAMVLQNLTFEMELLPLQSASERGVLR
jgi:hypothetical protein